MPDGWEYKQKSELGYTDNDIKRFINLEFGARLRTDFRTLFIVFSG